MDHFGDCGIGYIRDSTCSWQMVLASIAVTIITLLMVALLI